MEESFKNFQATLLYCNKCRRAMPVRERLLLVLPEGNLYDYTCQGCGESVGSKSDKVPTNRTITDPLIRSS